MIVYAVFFILQANGLFSDKLRANLLLKQYYLEVDLQHVGLYNEEMAHRIQEEPGEHIPRVCHIVLDTLHI